MTYSTLVGNAAGAGGAGGPTGAGGSGGDGGAVDVEAGGGSLRSDSLAENDPDPSIKEDVRRQLAVMEAETIEASGDN